MDINQVPQSHPEPTQQTAAETVPAQPKPLEPIAGEEMDKHSIAEKAMEAMAGNLVGQYVEILDESIKNQTDALNSINGRLDMIEEIIRGRLGKIEEILSTSLAQAMREQNELQN